MLTRPRTLAPQPDGRMMEESLWAQLKPLGVDPLGKNHEQLGNVGDLVTKKFTKMKYIQATEVHVDEGRVCYAAVCALASLLCPVRY